jgi:integrase
LFTRTRYQNGSITKKRRADGTEVWEFRWYETDTRGGRQRRAVTAGSTQVYRTESAARRSAVVQAVLLRINAECPQAEAAVPSFGAVIARYEQEELPERYSTRTAYLSIIKNHIRPRWADVPLGMVKPMTVEDWLKRLDLAPKTKSHIRGVMHTIFRCAERWELTERNPIRLVRVKSGTKRQTTPIVLTIEQFNALLECLREPHRTMVLVAGCLGLRVSEIMGLQWRDFDFTERTALVQRGVVHGRVDEVKTEYSRDRVPLDAALVDSLLKHKARSIETAEGWLFANPRTGRPFHQEEIQKNYLRKAAKEAGIGDNVGWHTFRHSYRSWLDDTGAQMSVQKELMRHASVQTTMNVYGKAMTDSKRQAHSKVVQMVLKGGDPTADAESDPPLNATGS